MGDFGAIQIESVTPSKQFMQTLGACIVSEQYF